MKVKIRVAVAIDHEHNYNAAGWPAACDDDVMSAAVEHVKAGARRYWLETELDPAEPNNAQTVTPEVREG